jgi:hypothetical protein
MDYRLTRDQIKEGVKICYDKIQSLLNHSEIILKVVPDSNVVIGLHTIAIEELGKLLLLQDAVSTIPNSDGTFNVKREIFGMGGGSHTQIKFQKILPMLPDKCKKVGNVIGAVPITQPIRVGDVLIRMRKDVFYVDWDDINKKWKTDVKIDPAHILTAVNELKQWISQNISV